MCKVKKSHLISGLCLMVLCIASIIIGTLAAKSASAKAYESLPDSATAESAQNANNEQNELLAFNDITTVSGLGLGINVITASQVNDFQTEHSILDISKLQDLSVIRNNLSETIVNGETAINEKELRKYFSTSQAYGVSADFFLGSISFGIEHSIAHTYLDQSYKYYYVFKEDFKKYRLYFDNYASASTYQDAFSAEYLNDLAALKNGNLTYRSFFSKYGTHLIGSAIYGGKLRAFYTLTSEKLLVNDSTRTDIDSGILGNVTASTTTDILAKVNTAFSLSGSEQLTTSDIHTGFYVHTMGGEAFSGSSMATFSTAHSSWAKSFSSETYDDSKSVLIDYNLGGLLGLWKILPEEYASLATPMENEFKLLLKEKEDAFANSFSVGNTKSFGGGTGNANDPFIIKTKQHLLNITPIYLKSNFKLMADIDLSNLEWEPIGGTFPRVPVTKDGKTTYEDRGFCGIFDGNNYTIKRLTRTKDPEEINDRIYFGLFGCIGTGGVVRDLTFLNTNIHMTGPAVNNSQTRVFVGVVAGKIAGGSVSNVHLTGGSCYYDRCTNGSAFVGSIVGLADCAVIRSCKNDIPITGGRYSGHVGGIAAYANNTTLEDCSNTATLQGHGTGYGGYCYVGGIAAQITASTKITNCVNSGTLQRNRYKGMGPTFHGGKGDIYATITKNYYE